MPKIVLYSGRSEKTYNASATNLISKMIEITTVTKGDNVKEFKKEKIEESYTLTLGEGLLRLLLWNKDAKILLSSIIAHEIGHMYHGHTSESKNDEFQADSKAIELIGKSNLRQKFRELVFKFSERHNAANVVESIKNKDFFSGLLFYDISLAFLTIVFCAVSIMSGNTIVGLVLLTSIGFGFTGRLSKYIREIFVQKAWIGLFDLLKELEDDLDSFKSPYLKALTSEMLSLISEDDPDSLFYLSNTCDNGR